MDFFQRVGIVCSRIPEGKVATYGQLAYLCGKPRNARQVGRALGRGAATVAHRVVNGRGFLSGAGAFLFDGAQRGSFGIRRCYGFRCKYGRPSAIWLESFFRGRTAAFGFVSPSFPFSDSHRSGLYIQ